MDPLTKRAVESLLGYLRLGNEIVTNELVTFVRNPALPNVSDANHGSMVKARTEDEIDEVLAMADEVLASSPYKSFKVTPETPASFEARLALEGYRSSVELTMLLEGRLRADPLEVDIRPVVQDTDWNALRALMRLNSEEDAEKAGRTQRQSQVRQQMFLDKKGKSPDVAYFLANVDGQDAAFFSAWPGHNGIGVVEHLFTRPEYRRRGLATALMAHAVDDARARGATSVLVNADPDDTPKAMYAGLGFRPILLYRGYWKDLPSDRAASR